MIALLKIGDKPIWKIRDYSYTITKVEGGGGGITESGDEILDYRTIDKAVINVTFANLTKEEHTALMEKIMVKTLELTYWCGVYKTITVKVGDIASEMLKSESRTNTEEYNSWNVTTTFTQIRTG